MDYINTETGEWGLTAGDIRQRHPLTIFPEPFEPLPEYAAITEQPAPAHDDRRRAVPAAPIKQGQQWLQQWRLVLLTAHELAQRDQERAQAEQAQKEAQRVTISRTLGLVYLWRELEVQEGDIEALIADMEDPGQRYEAGLYFRAASWDSDNPYVAQFAAAVGLDTPAKLADAFSAARQL